MPSPDWADAVALLRQETAHPLQVIDEEPRRQCSADGEYNQIGCIADHASPLLKAFARFSRSFASASNCDAIRRSSSLPCGVVRAIVRSSMTPFRRNRSVSAGSCHLIPSLRQRELLDWSEMTREADAKPITLRATTRLGDQTQSSVLWGRRRT